MPINFEILNNGHLIYATAEGRVTEKDFVDYEIIHSANPELKSPVNELFEIKRGAFDNLTEKKIKTILEKRSKLSKTKRHKCALVVSMSDLKGWDLAKFYENLFMLHQPSTVIVFGDLQTAKIWLGIK